MALKLFPSLLPSDVLKLPDYLSELGPLCDGFHIDIMDFHFVPNLCWSPDAVNAIRKATLRPLTIHLMVDYPELYFDLLHLNKHDIVSIHYESLSNYQPTELFAKMNPGWRKSLAISPETPINTVKSLLPLVDHILLMAVHPGFSGQQYLPDTDKRLIELIEYKKEHNASFIIAIDGGITKEKALVLHELGAQQIVLGSAIFKDNHPQKALKDFSSLFSKVF